MCFTRIKPPLLLAWLWGKLLSSSSGEPGGVPGGKSDEVWGILKSEVCRNFATSCYFTLNPKEVCRILEFLQEYGFTEAGFRYDSLDSLDSLPPNFEETVCLQIQVSDGFRKMHRFSSCLTFSCFIPKWWFLSSLHVESENESPCFPSESLPVA